MRESRQSRITRLSVTAVFVSVVVCQGSFAWAAPMTRVDVRLDAHAGAIQGTVDIALKNPSRQPLTRMYLWLLPNRLSEPPEALDDVNHYWIYPESHNPGIMKLISAQGGVPGATSPIERSAWKQEPHALAGTGTLVSLALPQPVASGRSVQLQLRFWARIPERYGSFGCIDGRCTLMGGFYPMLAAVGEAGWELDAPPMMTDMDVSVELARPASVVLFDRVFGQAPEGALVAAARARAPGVPYAPLFVVPRLYESKRVQAGITMRYLSRERPPPTDIAHEKTIPYTMENHARHALDSVGESLELMATIHVPVRTKQLIFVEAPLRFSLASAHPGVVAVSNRFYRIWPAKRFRKFHQRQLIRAVFDRLMTETIAARNREHARDRSAAADFVASFLTDLYVVKRYKKSESMGDILQPVAFIPVVDQLLYAPQTMFADAYFGGVLDTEPLRDHPMRFMHQRPRGRLFYEKLRDLLDAEALRTAMRAVIVDGVPFRRAAETAYGSPLAWFFEQWDGPYPVVNYRLLSRSSKRLPTGRYEHKIQLERRSEHPEQLLVEPVTVLVVLKGGKQRFLRWDGRGTRGVLRFQDERAIDRVVIDPRRRLVENRLHGEIAHPLFDNRDKHRIRFVYNSFGVLLNLSDLSGLLAVDFTLGRVRDVEHRSRFSLYTSASVLVGVTGRYTRSFGDPVTSDQLLSSVTARVSGQRLRTGFFGDDSRTASRLSLGLGFGASDRLFAFEPRFARDLGIGASLTVTRRDAAGEEDAEFLLSGGVGAAYARIFTLRGDHTLAVDIDGAIVLGDLAIRSQLLGGGGAGALRGYAPGELFGRSRLMLRAEYRHLFTHQMNWNLGHYNFVRGIGGALFADVGLLSPCDGYNPARTDSAYASVGYGLRFLYDSFGTLPQMMRLDVALPLMRRARTCLGMTLPTGPPVMVYLRFLPPF